MTPQYRLNDTGPNLQEDASVASTRSLQDYRQRTLPNLANQGAALGQTGSSGLQTRAENASTDMNRAQSDIYRMLGRNTANISKQKVLATMGMAGF
jgi:hypothetical protein